jgi:anti-sigma regulatory factor (Ser/Thr protein kinase)
LLRYAVAGHAPPIIATVTGEVYALPGEGMLLGIDADTYFTALEHRLAAGESLILYTDGIVEVERDYIKGTADLENAIRAEFLSPSTNLAEGIQQRVFRDNPPRDDAALLVVTLPVVRPATDASGVATRSWDFDARNREAGRKVKRELLSALRGLGPDAPDLTITEIVFGELLSNVVKHTPGPARITFTLHDGHVVLEVHDRDRSFAGDIHLHGNASPPPADAESGRGLFLICALCTHVTVTATSEGKCTTVVLPRVDEGNGAGVPSAERVRAAP